MSRIIVEIKECSMYDVYKLIEQIKKNKHVADAYHVQGDGWLTLPKSADTKSDADPKKQRKP